MRRQNKLTIKPVFSNVAIAERFANNLINILQYDFKSLKNDFEAFYDHEIASDKRLDPTLRQMVREAYLRHKRVTTPYLEREAERFILEIERTTKRQFRNNAKQSGILIDTKRDPKEIKEIAKLIRQNVKLIKTIPKEYLNKFEAFMNIAVSRGVDRAYVEKRLNELDIATKRKIHLLAVDQCNKISHQILVRQCLDMGITRGRWVHVPGEYSSRLTHIEMDGEEFDLTEGLYDSAVDDYVVPTQLPYCRCTFECIIPGFEE